METQETLDTVSYCGRSDQSAAQILFKASAEVCGPRKLDEEPSLRMTGGVCSRRDPGPNTSRRPRFAASPDV